MKAIRWLPALSAVLLLGALAPVFADDDSGTVVGWGTQEYGGSGDLDKAIELSQQKARLDLSANILTYVNVKTVDETVQSGGSVKEQYKNITVTKVVQLLREVNMHQPVIDSQNHLVTTKAEVSKATARQIIQDAMARLKAKREQYQQDQDQVKMITEGGRYYYKQQILQLDNQKDLGRIDEEADQLKKGLIHDQLRDIQDVRNNVKTVFFKNFPEDSQTTLLAYIEITQYNYLVQNYDAEIYRASVNTTSTSAFGHQSPNDMAKVAESTLPAKDFNDFAVGCGLDYVAGTDPELNFNVNGSFFHAEGNLGLQTDLGFVIAVGGNQITQNSPYTGQNAKAWDFHFPLEVDGMLYFSEVQSGKDIPYVRFGGLGAFSWASASDPDTNSSTDLASHLALGETVGVGLSLFRKQAGVFMKVEDFGVAMKFINGGYYGEGGQVSIGAYENLIL